MAIPINPLRLTSTEDYQDYIGQQLNNYVPKSTIGDLNQYGLVKLYKNSEEKNASGLDLSKNEPQNCLYINCAPQGGLKVGAEGLRKIGPIIYQNTDMTNISFDKSKLVIDITNVKDYPSSINTERPLLLLKFNEDIYGTLDPEQGGNSPYFSLRINSNNDDDIIPIRFEGKTSNYYNENVILFKQNTLILLEYQVDSNNNKYWEDVTFSYSYSASAATGELAKLVTYFGICKTPAGTKTKEVNIKNLPDNLEDGITIRVRFENGINHTVGAMLKINSLEEAQDIMLYKNEDLYDSNSSFEVGKGAEIIFSYSSEKEAWLMIGSGFSWDATNASPNSSLERDINTLKNDVQTLTNDVTVLKQNDALTLENFQNNISSLNQKVESLENFMHYSSTPVEIGTWTDGKKVWRISFPYIQMKRQNRFLYVDSNTNNVSVSISPLLPSEDALPIRIELKAYSEQPMYINLPEEINNGVIYFCKDNPKKFDDYITQGNGYWGGYIDYVSNN